VTCGKARSFANLTFLHPDYFPTIETKILPKRLELVLIILKHEKTLFGSRMLRIKVESSLIKT